MRHGIFISGAGIALLISPNAVQAQASYQALHSFTGGINDGSHPHAAMLQASDGNFYGSTVDGGTFNFGTIYRMTLDGTLSVIHSFSGYPDDGESPYAPLIEVDGKLYGTTRSGGANRDGTIFQIALDDGTVSIRHSFDRGTEGRTPAALVQGPDGNFYGTTLLGGNAGYGTVFMMASDGVVSTLHEFSNADGATPYGLISASDGRLYGTTLMGGTFGQGTIFQLTTDGAFTIVHLFSGGDGAGPMASLVEAPGGSFYGTTAGGGFFGGLCGAVGCGTIFQLTPDWNLLTLYAFAGGGDGYTPTTALLQEPDGTLWGTAERDGTSNGGTLFQLTLDGTLMTLHVFGGDEAEGALPTAALIQGSDGGVYGTTAEGGSAGLGVVFRVSLGAQ